MIIATIDNSHNDESPNDIYFYNKQNVISFSTDIGLKYIDTKQITKKKKK